MNAWSCFIAAPPSRRGRPPINLPDEEKRKRRQIQRAERYQRVKEQKEENSDAERVSRNNSPRSNTHHATSQPLGFDSRISGAIHGLDLHQKSDKSVVSWVKSLTPENYTAANLVNVSGGSLNPSLIISEGREQSLALSATLNQSGSGASSCTRINPQGCIR